MMTSKRFAAAVLAVVCGWVVFQAGCTGDNGNAASAAKAPAANAEAGAEGTEHAGADGHGSPNPLAFDPDLAIATLIIFLILFFVLKKFAWKPISHALEERERAIENNIAKAEGAAAEARAMLAEYEKKLAGASDEVRGMLEEARRDAEATKQEIVAEARVAARQEQDRALREINTAKDRALKELAETSTNIAVDLAGKLIKTKLTRDEHAELVQEAISKFVAGAPSRN
jgi:F-type H+-transporting ATPase subunit b